MAWKKGPLPKGTWMWGGVVPASHIHKPSGFFFADFVGDHVIMNPGTPQAKRLEAEDVGWYCNCLELPIKEEPAVTGRAPSEE